MAVAAGADALHPWQLFDAPYVHRSKRITSSEYVVVRERG